MKIKNINLGYVTLFSVCLMSFLTFAAPVHSKNEFKLKLGAKGQICLKCHETLKKTLKSRFVHPLLKKGECIGCHVPHTSSHKSLLNEDRAKLCYNCHKEVLPENARSSHDVVVEGNCKTCHDSHGSNNRFILSKSGNELCLDCHKDMSADVRKVRFKHKSLENRKGCLNCHDPHASAKSSFLLESQAPTLCLKCHKTDKASFAKKHMNYPVKNADCTSCHNPHGSNNRGIIFDVAHAAVTEGKCTECHQKPTSLKTKKKTTQLCRECHKDMVDQTFNKNRVHWPLVDKVGCVNCHDPHATKEQKLLKGSIVNVCGRCHADTVELQEWSIKNPKNDRLCEPVKKGNCITCHSPHAADNVLLITQKSVTNDLCGRCHEWETHSTHPIGAKIIDNRNKNLTVECLTCHQACGTGNKPAMLTFSNTYELCLQCHVERRT
ncbi:MAG: cytochrome c3 family protein [Deltaproteobacteria bacterium]|nr:cytochrome c3 family protein [Deltaproteobacteria bacterium]